MAIKWAEVTQKPEFQSLSPLEKHQAQEQYFEEQVVPQINTDDIPVARNQFFTEFPTEFNKAIDEHVKDPKTKYQDAVLRFNEAKQKYDNALAEREELQNNPPDVWSALGLGGVKKKVDYWTSPVTDERLNEEWKKNVINADDSTLEAMLKGNKVYWGAGAPAHSALGLVRGSVEFPVEALKAQGAMYSGDLKPATELVKGLFDFIGRPTGVKDLVRAWTEEGKLTPEKWSEFEAAWTKDPFGSVMAIAPFVKGGFKTAVDTAKAVKKGYVGEIKPAIIKEAVKETPKEHIAGEVPLEELPDSLKTVERRKDLAKREEFLNLTPEEKIASDSLPEGFTIEKVPTGLVDLTGNERFRGTALELKMPDGRTAVGELQGLIDTAKAFNENVFKKPAKTQGNIASLETPKEPWQMTKGEFSKKSLKDAFPNAQVDYQGRKMAFDDLSPGQATNMAENYFIKNDKTQDHLYFVKQALSEGKPIPPEVLKDYPELQKPINDTWKLTPSQAQERLEGQINMDLYQRSIKEAVELGLPANKEGLKRYADKGMDWAKKALEATKVEQPNNIVQWTLDKGGINYTAEHWKGELRDLRDTLNQGKRIGIGNRVIKSQGKYTLDQLALMARDEGLINEATPQALLDAMQKTKFGVEKLPEPSIPKTEIDIANLKEGDKVFINGEEYQHKGFDAKGNAILKDGLDYSLDAFDKFNVDADVKGSPIIQRTATAKQKPVQMDMVGVPKDALKHPLLSKEMGETLLEKMVEESKTREVQKQETKKQGKFDFLSVEPYSEPIGEAGYIKMGKSKDIPDVDIKKVVSKDINPLEQGLTTLHVADRHPFMKPAIETAIKATQDTHHAVTQRIEKLTKIFDEAEGKPLFGLIKRRSSALRDIDLMVEGKKATPASLKDFVENIKSFLGEERQRVIGNQKQEILSKATESQKKYLKYLSEGGEEPQVKGVVKQAAYELKAALLEADKWGQTDYFPHSMAGDYYYLGSDGRILSIGKTPKQAKFNLMERLESNPELKGSTVYFVNGLKSMLSTRHTLNPELRGTLEQLGVSLPRKKFFGLLNKIENMVDAEISEAGVGDVKGVNVDLKGIAKMQSNKKFAGNLLKRHTEMRGQEADPFKTLSTYTAAVERNLGLSNAKKYLINFEESLPPHMENAKTYIRKLRENMLGYYDWGNKLVDQTIGKKIGAKPYLLSRTLQKGQSLTANLTLGYAPVKALINVMDGNLSTLTKTGIKHWANGYKMLFTKEGKALINEIGHLAGLEESFAYSHKAMQPSVNLLKPMGLYQGAETVVNRPHALLSGYSQGLEIYKGDIVKAKEHAVDIARLTQTLYDVVSKPVAVRGAALSTAYQFKQFINGKIRFLDSLTPKQMSFYIPSIVALYGTRGIWLTLKSIIGITLISDILGNVGEKTNEELNKKHPQLHRGLFGLAGLDVSAAGTVQLPTEFKDWAGKFYVDTYKAGNMIVKGLKNNGWTDEEIADYINSVAPVGYNIYKGLQMATKGEIREGQKLMYKGSPYEAIANLSGAKTVKQSQAQDTIRYENQMKQSQTDKMKVVKKNLLSPKTQDEFRDNLAKAIEIKGISTDKELEDFGKGLLNEMIKNNLTARQRVFMTLPKNIKRSEIREYQK